jgi:hypothetical protein
MDVHSEPRYEVPAQVCIRLEEEEAKELMALLAEAGEILFDQLHNEIADAFMDL